MNSWQELLHQKIWTVRQIGSHRVREWEAQSGLNELKEIARNFVTLLWYRMMRYLRENSWVALFPRKEGVTRK